MNNRRKFLINSGMTAAAIIATRPFKALANTESLLGINANNSYVVLLHTNGLNKSNHQQSLNFVAAVQSKTKNAVLIDSSNLTDDEFKIVENNGMLIGVIHIRQSKSISPLQLTKLATQLRKQKQCKVIICQSDIGFSAKEGVCDIQLAPQSSGVDVFIGTHSTNFAKEPRIYLNALKHEVVLQSSRGDESALGKVEIGFDRYGCKNHIHILNHVPKKNQKQQTNAIIIA